MLAPGSGWHNTASDCESACLQNMHRKPIINILVVSINIINKTFLFVLITDQNTWLRVCCNKALLTYISAQSTCLETFLCCLWRQFGFGFLLFFLMFCLLPSVHHWYSNTYFLVCFRPKIETFITRVLYFHGCSVGKAYGVGVRGLDKNCTKTWKSGETNANRIPYIAKTIHFFFGDTSRLRVF